MAASRMVRVTVAPVLQVAADGRWETAKVVPMGGDPAHARTVVAQVARSARDDVAVEFLWPTQAFVGARWPTDSWRQAVVVADRRNLVLSSGDYMPQDHVIEAGLLALLDTAPSPDLEFVELGAVNAWQSVGPQRLWRRGDVLTDSVLESTLSRRPDLTSCAHPVAVELCVTHPQPCWVGIYISTGSDPIHHLDRRALKSILGRVL